MKSLSELIHYHRAAAEKTLRRIPLTKDESDKVRLKHKADIEVSTVENLVRLANMLRTGT